MKRDDWLYAKILLATLVPCVLTVQAQPQPTTRDSVVTINFDTVTTTGYGEGGQTRISNQYQGVTFNNVSVMDFSRGIAKPDFPHSGSRAIIGCYGAEFCADTAIEVRFSDTQQRVRVWAGTVGLRSTATLTMAAYDNNGKTVALTSDSLPADAVRRISTALEVRADSNEISSVKIFVNNAPLAAIALDDLEFARIRPRESAPIDTAQPPIPEVITGTPAAPLPWWHNPVWLVVVAVALIGGAAVARNLLKTRLPTVKPRLSRTGIENQAVTFHEAEPMNLSIQLSIVSDSLRAVTTQTTHREATDA